ncbi:MAG: hypothetical protein AB8B65_17040 [Kordia sp.]|uniref:hypothetical protein n=1 Tax=Kordia sp. TaxID=1965332 RepID=UPI0038590FE3
MRKLKFIKNTIAKLENLDQLKAGAAGNYTGTCDSEEECTYSIVPSCPATSSRAAEGRRNGGGK